MQVSFPDRKNLDFKESNFSFVKSIGKNLHFIVTQLQKYFDIFTQNVEE